LEKAAKESGDGKKKKKIRASDESNSYVFNIKRGTKITSIQTLRKCLEQVRGELEDEEDTTKTNARGVFDTLIDLLKNPEFMKNDGYSDFKEKVFEYSYKIQGSERKYGFSQLVTFFDQKKDELPKDLGDKYFELITLLDHGPAGADGACVAFNNNHAIKVEKYVTTLANGDIVTTEKMGSTTNIDGFGKTIDKLNDSNKEDEEEEEEEKNAEEGEGAGADAKKTEGTEGAGADAKKAEGTEGDEQAKKKTEEANKNAASAAAVASAAVAAASAAQAVKRKENKNAAPATPAASTESTASAASIAAAAVAAASNTATKSQETTPTVENTRNMSMRAREIELEEQYAAAENSAKAGTSPAVAASASAAAAPTEAPRPAETPVADPKTTMSIKDIPKEPIPTSEEVKAINQLYKDDKVLRTSKIGSILGIKKSLNLKLKKIVTILRDILKGSNASRENSTNKRNMYIDTPEYKGQIAQLKSELQYLKDDPNYNIITKYPDAITKKLKVSTFWKNDEEKKLLAKVDKLFYTYATVWDRFEEAYEYFQDNKEMKDTIITGKSASEIGGNFRRHFAKLETSITELEKDASDTVMLEEQLSAPVT
jgi:hypothetical protein